MKRKIRSVSVLIVMVLIVLLTSCSNISNFGVLGFRETMTEQETTNTKISKVDKIWINNNIGTITINKTEGEYVKVRMKKTVHGQEKKEVKEVIDTIAPKAELVDGRLEIQAVTREGKSDAWSWLSSNHNKLNVNIDLYIDIPKSFKDYNVINVIGNVAINDITGSLKIENMTGNIDINNSILNGSNRIMLTTGNIDMNVDIKNSTSLEATNSTGNVKLAIPSTSKINLSASVTTGVINGSFNGMESKSGIGGIDFNREFNGGGKEVVLKSITGNIEVNSR